MSGAGQGIEQAGFDEWGRDPKAPLLVRLAALGIAGYLRAIYATARLDCLQPEVHRSVYAAEGGTIIGAFWHNQLALASLYYWGLRRVCLASRSRDGELLTRVLTLLDNHCVRGSTTALDGRDKGGSSALRALVRASRAGFHMVITPDGPKGPPERAQMGTVVLASLCGGMILPFGIALNRYIRLGSWDKTFLPLPFTRIVLSYEKPLSVPRTNDAEVLESHRLDLERRLHSANARAWEAIGRAER